MMHGLAPRTVKTTCPYCGVGCGVAATPDGRGGAAIAGDVDHPANLGRLCSKGSALGETLALETRLLHPMMKGARVEWDMALDAVADGLRRVIETHGPDAVAFYLSGQLLTEDYYIANKLMKGFIGSAHVDTNSRLCMASTVAGHKRALGSDTVPGCYEDLDRADLLVLTGSNAAWCHPVLHQRMMAAKARGARMIVIDPRGTETSEGADQHIALRHGTDGALFSGLFVYLADGGYLDHDFIAAHTRDFDAALARARSIAPDIDATARACGLKRVAVASFFEAWARTPRVVTLYSQGVNQSIVGTDKVAAILNCHLATSRIGREGMGPFSLTGQPNAMGGREVGGLANQLAAHMGFEPASVERVGRFWNAPNMARAEGLKAVDMFDAIASGRVKALWIMGTNPAVSLPRADDIRASLRKLDLLVVSENVNSTDSTTANAILLPACAWGEKDGTVTNSERRISRQRPFMPPAGEARPDWMIMRDVARRLGFAGFDYNEPADIFREHAALSTFENDGQRDFDLGPLATLDGEAYDALAPVQWPVRADGTGEQRLFAKGGFFTVDGRAKFIAIAPPVAARSNDAFPFILNTGRVRDQWHTMMRSGLSQRLGAHRPEPFVTVHPDDAARAGLVAGGLARVASAHGAATLRVEIDAGQEPGTIFAPIHWNDETAGGGRVGALVHPSCDPFSGQPDSKATPANIAPVAFARAGFIAARHRFAPPGGFWAWRPVDGGFTATLETDADDAAILAALRAVGGDGDELTLRDEARGLFRAALLRDGRIEAIAFLGSARPAAVFAMVAEAFRAERLEGAARRALLAGRATVADAGPLVCACFGVPLNTIQAAINAGAATPEAIGAATKAGTNCGSCLPELRRMTRALAPA